MPGLMKWIDGKLYLKSNNGISEWTLYTAPKYRQLSAPDHNIPNGSPGYATMQKLLKLGWTYDSQR